MDNANRPSVIVFHQSHPTDNNIVHSEDNDIEVVYDSVFDDDRNFNNLESEPIIDLNEIVNENDNNNFDSGIDNERVDNLHVDDNPTSNLRVEDYFTLNPSTVRNARMPGVLFENVDTVINPAVYRHENSEDFTATFRELFQSIFDNVVNRIESENPGAYQSVRVSMRSEGFADPVNLNWVGLNNLSSELFLIELYNLIQSQRDVITTNNLTIGFTFTKYEQGIFQ
jgi:hypothetical protein